MTRPSPLSDHASIVASRFGISASNVSVLEGTLVPYLGGILPNDQSVLSIFLIGSLSFFLIRVPINDDETSQVFSSLFVPKYGKEYLLSYLCLNISEITEIVCFSDSQFLFLEINQLTTVTLK